MRISALRHLQKTIPTEIVRASNPSMTFRKIPECIMASSPFHRTSADTAMTLSASLHLKNAAAGMQISSFRKPFNHAMIASGVRSW
ncbi:hypothetical protein SH668x_000123 [Planctomicrobium sp. SH668]|uniref:hypothetical protein n=1 Tax=Planctomicrobium sp. SH668 TaxID=3448126 RepID=UPI003F5C2D84